MTHVSFSIATAPQPGAIGIVQLYGATVAELVARLIGRSPVQGRCIVADLGSIDEGLVALLRPDWAQLMPHAGPRVMQRLAERLMELGAHRELDPPARRLYPEAGSDLEADMLAALARAASAAAIDPLLAQPALWRCIAERSCSWPELDHDDPRRHLIEPPSVVLVGQANVGKSTLTNLVLGRSASITADLPGTTRDWVAGLAELPTPIGGLAVRWFDTPGIREGYDPIERRAVHLARGVIEAADVLIAVRDPATKWPTLTGTRRPDIWLWNKMDLLAPGSRNVGDAIPISGLTGQGLEQLGGAVAGALGLRAIDTATPWPFSEKLRRIVRDQDHPALMRYCGMIDTGGELSLPSPPVHTP